MKVRIERTDLSALPDGCGPRASLLSAVLFVSHRTQRITAGATGWGELQFAPSFPVDEVHAGVTLDS